MIIRGISLLATLLIVAAHPSMASSFDHGATPVPSGEYRVIALRSASDVASTPDADVDIIEWIGRTVSFGDTLQWLDGSSCDIWSAREAEQFPLDLNDPNLSDLAIEPLSPPAYHVFAQAMSLDLICNENGSRRIGSVIQIDDRILVMQSASGSTNIILEKPLSSPQVSQLQEQLKDMKFYDGEITGELDEATLKSVGFYAEYRGSQFRFLRTAITENLLDGLGVLDIIESDDEAMFPGYQPKRSADSLQEYSPEFATQLENTPEVALENLAELLNELNNLDLEASKMSGGWISGNLALGANQKEYAPSYSEIRAAALGDRLSAFISAIDPDEMARQWPANTDRYFSYRRFDIRHADVMGSGRFFYASAPILVSLEIPEVSK